MDKTTFAQKIRDKYPGAYDHIDDDTLVSKVIEKYPVYKDKVKMDTMESEDGYLNSEDESVEEAPKNPTPWKSRSVGWAKGLAEGPIETAALLQKGGQLMIAALDPTKTYEQIKQETGIESLNDQSLTQIREMLKSDNKEEKQGKLLEFVAELIWPGSKADEVQAGLKKGKEVIQEGLEKGKNAIDETTIKVVDKTKEIVEKVVTKPIQPQYETTLRRIKPEQFDEYAETAKKAAVDFKASTPLEIVGKKAEGALEVIQGKLKQLGKLKRSQILTYGDKNVGTIATKFTQNLEAFGKGSLVDGDSKLVKQITAKAKALGHNPTASAVDDFVDYAQDLIYTSGRDLTVPVTDGTTAQLRKFVGQLNSNLKDQLPAGYSKLNDMYSNMYSVMSELNTKLGKEGEKGGSLMKRVFSPSDANTKELFQQVKDLTGVDLVDEATLARMLMEVAGDSRQASLLEQLKLPNMTKSGILDRIWSEITEKFNTPEARLKRMRELIQGEIGVEKAPK